ncbi:MAG: ATP-binding protein, partial [Bacteroidota bacterium]
WFGTREGVFQYDGYEFKAYRHDLFDENSLSHPAVNAIVEDHKNRLWIATSRGLSLFDRRTERFQRFIPFDDTAFETRNNSNISTLIEIGPGKFLLGIKAELFLFEEASATFTLLPIQNVNSEGYFPRHFLLDGDQLWIGTSKGILHYQISENTCSVAEEEPLAAIRSRIMGLQKAKDGTVWIATAEHLYRYTPATKKLEEVSLPEFAKKERITNLFIDSQDHIWIAFQAAGLGLYDPIHQRFRQITHHPNDINSLNSNSVTSIFEDRFNNIWVGTVNGISKLRQENRGFNFLKNKGATGHTANNVQRLVEAESGTIYTKTYDGVYEKKKGAATAEKIFLFDDKRTRFGLDWFLEDAEGGIWLTVSEDGLYRKDKYASTFQKMQYGELFTQVGYYRIMLDHTDSDLIWLGTTQGLCRLNWKTGEHKWYRPKSDLPTLISNAVSLFEQYGDDQIWLYYTFSKSIGHFDKQTGVFTLTPIPEDQQKYLGGHMKDIAIGNDGNIWIASLYGLTNYNIHTGAFQFFGKKDGLIENELQAVLMDKNENLWVSGRRFIATLDREKGVFINYEDRKRMQNFQSKSRAISKSGNLLFGSINGIYAFNPEQLKKNPRAPELVLTNFKVNNESYTLPVAFEEAESITLAHQQNNITFEFSGLHYFEPEAVQYKCMLEGYETDWRDLGTEHKVRYTNLNHGNYTFKVSAANLDGVWNEEGIVIPLRISPAFWETYWFRGLLLLLLVLMGNLVYQNQKRQAALQRQKVVAEQSAAYKTRFLADVSHEIRTPMNAIIGLSKLTMETKLDDKQYRFVSAIQESSKNLLGIINDLLDYTKLESGKFKFSKNHFALARVLKNIGHTLGYNAQEKQLTFIQTLDPKIPNKLIGDPIRLNQILTNLVGNAIKFTNEGKVWLTVSLVDETDRQVQLQFEIGDTGIGIPQDKLEFIFGSWNQTDAGVNKGMEGTGLGLPIAKQLVERQHGQLQLSSKEGEGTIIAFSLTFDKVVSDENLVTNAAAIDKIDRLKILVVEDTYFNQMLLEEFLKKNITDPSITFANNGKFAIAEVQKNSFDIVLMDVKMPVMDGFEATRVIRQFTDEKLRDIPIIAITASAVQDQLDKCKEAGMNDYVTKPIDEQELLRKIYLHTQT